MESKGNENAFPFVDIKQIVAEGKREYFEWFSNILIWQIETKLKAFRNCGKVKLISHRKGEM